MKKSVTLVSSLVMLAGLGIASSALANHMSPCAKADGWHFFHKTNLSYCDGLSHHYHCRVTQFIYHSGKSKTFVNLKRVIEHGKYVHHSIADKKVVFHGSFDAGTVCAKTYKLDYQK